MRLICIATGAALLGDCGRAQTWTWTAQGFVLTAETAMEDCLGMVPDVWPSTWRTR
ncbi:MAG: DUF1176 domain-containing protein [Brevundimonas sp.]